MAGMANIASLLKSEISRVARKEVRADILGLKKTVGGYRTETAALKQRAQALEAGLRRLGKACSQARQLPAIAALRTLGKKQAAAQLASWRSSPSRAWRCP